MILLPGGGGVRSHPGEKRAQWGREPCSKCRTRFGDERKGKKHSRVRKGVAEPTPTHPAQVVVLGFDWPGVLLGTTFLLLKVLPLAARVLVAPPNMAPDPGGGGGSVLGWLLALFAAILVPALASCTAVELIPQLREPAIAPVALLLAILVGVSVALLGVCACLCHLRRRPPCRSP